MKRDMTNECMQSLQTQMKKGRALTSERELRHYFCRRCRNKDCSISNWGSSMWENRINTQVDRLLVNPNFANPNDPKYADIRKMDFKNLLQEAMRLEISSSRGDWMVPDVDLGPSPTLFTAETMEEAVSSEPTAETKRIVDNAVRMLARARQQMSPEPEPEPEPEKLAPPPPPEPEPEPVERKPPPITRLPNTKVPPHGVMIGGGPVPPSSFQAQQSGPSPQRQQPQPARRPPSRQVHDPWNPNSKGRVVKPGTTIRLGKKK